MTPEQNALIEKAHSSLQAAQLLFQRGFFDFSVSRAYYSMFYIAEALLLGEGLAYSKHSAVIAAFGQIFAKSGRVPVEFHRYLIEAEGSRRVGDYDMMSKLTIEDAREQIERARKLIDVATRLTSSSK